MKAEVEDFLSLGFFVFKMKKWQEIQAEIISPDKFIASEYSNTKFNLACYTMRQGFRCSLCMVRLILVIMAIY